MASISITQFYIRIKINKKIGKTMIDSGAIGNFIIRKYMESKKYLLRSKKQLYGLINLNSMSLDNN